MIFQKIDFATPLFDQALFLRTKLLRIPLGMEFEIEDIEQEWQEEHFALLMPDQELVACLTLKSIDDETYKMRQVAVEESCQGYGFGSMLVRKTEEWCKENGIKMLVLNARENAVSFYLKLNYTIVGDVFEEVGIPHNKMQKKIR